jgi:hypothetical protein
MRLHCVTGIHLPEQARSFYLAALDLLEKQPVPFLVGGAFALKCYTGIDRDTKDFDIFVRSEDCPPLLDVFNRAGWHTEVTFSHWLAKAYQDERFFDIIYCSGNGLCPVDDEWFQHALPGEILGHRVPLVPVEEMIWQKAFIMERERFDGADVNHLLLEQGDHLDWARLLRRFGPHWKVLFNHLILFSYVYPWAKGRNPGWVLKELFKRWQTEADLPPTSEQVCSGTFLSRSQYLIDIEEWGCRDPRIGANGNMSRDERDVWTEAIPERQKEVAR